MGKMRMGILDGFIGKVGTVVGAFWKGKKVMRGYNEFPADPKTSKQELQRAKFGLLASIGGALLHALHLGMKSYSDLHASTELGAFMRLNLNKVSGETPEALEVDYETLSVSEGRLTAVALGEVDFSTPLTVSVAVDDNYLDPDFNSADDRLYLAVYSKTGGEAVLSDGTSKRTSESVSVRVPGYWQGHFVEVYAFMKAADSAADPEVCSKTLYCGSGRIA